MTRCDYKRGAGDYVIMFKLRFLTNILCFFRDRFLVSKSDKFLSVGIYWISICFDWYRCLMKWWVIFIWRVRVWNRGLWVSVIVNWLSQWIQVGFFCFWFKFFKVVLSETVFFSVLVRVSYSFFVEERQTVGSNLQD